MNPYRWDTSSEVLRDGLPAARTASANPYRRRIRAIVPLAVISLLLTGCGVGGTGGDTGVDTGGGGGAEIGGETGGETGGAAEEEGGGEAGGETAEENESTDAGDTGDITGGATGAVDLDGVESATVFIESAGTSIGPDGEAMSGARGSGFLISSDGYAVTNNHVVAGAGTVNVRVGGGSGTASTATLRGVSECLDLAVIQLEGEGYPFMDWHEGEIDTPQEVYAAGFPLGDPEFTMTKGIVSKASANGETQWASIDRVIEHDARQRGGNSGGPLVDEGGRVVGVNYANRTDDTDYAFAIHRDEVLNVLGQLIAGEDVLSIGVNGRALQPDDDGNPQGVWVSSVQSGSPADVAGITTGDRLLTLEATTLAKKGTLEEYCDVLGTQGTDSTMKVRVFRESDELFYEGEINGNPLEPLAPTDGPTDSDTGDEPAAPTGEFVTVTDDSGSITVDVPVAWADVSGVRYVDPVSGADYFDVTASSDLDAFSSSWGTGGVTVSVSREDAGADLQELIDRRTAPDACILDEAGPYDSGVFVGQFEVWTDCGDAGSRLVAIAARPSDNSFVIAVTIRLTEADDPGTLGRIIGSFNTTL